MQNSQKIPNIKKLDDEFKHDRSNQNLSQIYNGHDQSYNLQNFYSYSNFSDNHTSYINVLDGTSNDFVTKPPKPPFTAQSMETINKSISDNDNNEITYQSDPLRHAHNKTNGNSPQ